MNTLIYPVTNEDPQTLELRVRPCPPEVSARAMELLDDYRRGEVTKDEYDRRFAELVAEIARLEMSAERRMK